MLRRGFGPFSSDKKTTGLTVLKVCRTLQVSTSTKTTRSQATKSQNHHESSVTKSYQNQNIWGFWYETPKNPNSPQKNRTKRLKYQTPPFCITHPCSCYLFSVSFRFKEGWVQIVLFVAHYEGYFWRQDPKRAPGDYEGYGFLGASVAVSGKWGKWERARTVESCFRWF